MTRAPGESDQVSAVRIALELVHELLHLLGAIAVADKKDVGRVHDDEVLDPQGEDRSIRAVDQRAPGVGVFRATAEVLDAQ